MWKCHTHTHTHIYIYIYIYICGQTQQVKCLCHLVTYHYFKNGVLSLLLVVFVSDFQVLAFYHIFVKCSPYTLDSHGVGCLALLLNLVLLTVPS